MQIFLARCKDRGVLDGMRDGFELPSARSENTNWFDSQVGLLEDLLTVKL